MATKKTETKKAAPKKTVQTVTYNGKKWTVMEKNELTYKLTDGTIHVFAPVRNVVED